MKCPNCEETLVMTERQGIEIDYCPKCRGVWLDKGELDKIIEKSSSTSSADDYPRQERYQEKRQHNYYKDSDKHNPYRDSDKHYPYKKKKGFLGDLFDFD
jgi:Zn-finger nucleic acid-binding protein